ncbi:NAD(P)H-dependent oxidoreductase [Lapidilactobacillus luobeiensis]|uniref:NAD(P)H-dependent oxidoreductase n=1 Tax=Lapidilactobacillus luobeiensis TaxID=2950371 RepID=UPI0021C2E413|nr:NAD(P)H-dependent oxidoreductase [Lapidilactobacillus luobeiensis]
MRTLILVAHPEVANSPTQQFLKASLPGSAELMWHDLSASVGPDGRFQREAELALVRNAERLVLQFPFYWYSAPFILKQWQEQTFTGEVEQYHDLAGKELVVVLSLGQAETTYQAGASERFSLSELLRPYQAFAEKLGWRYLPPLVIGQFSYLAEAEKQQLLIQYQQLLTLPQPASFSERGIWLAQYLRTLRLTDPQQQQQLALVATQLQEQVAEYQDLQEQLREIRAGERD